MDMPDHSIFVQMASYRDPELIPTLIDLSDKAAQPGYLRAVVCWQHGPDETLEDFWGSGFVLSHVESWGEWTVHHVVYHAARIELIDVPHMRTRGVCWARHLLQQRYGGERYTLQLDSHHRFIQGWDGAVIAMLESLRDESPKPILTTYLPFYDPEHPDTHHSTVPGIMTFHRFTKQGVVLFVNTDLPDWEHRSRPVPARFYSAHFAFADGHFAEAVQHDPDYFFNGEEISIAARAFTHGYDLYHPHRPLAWHDYSGRRRPKMWQDHDWKAKQNGAIAQDWAELDKGAMKRNCELFGIDGTAAHTDHIGKYGFGTERTLADYEAYAGISFAYRGVQRATLEHQFPVRNVCRPDSEEAWKATLVRANEVHVCLHKNNFQLAGNAPGDEPIMLEAKSVHIRIYTCDGVLLYEKNWEEGELTHCRDDSWLSCAVAFQSELDQLPGRYIATLLDGAGQVLATGERAVA